jgi:hypothetical protein
MSTPSLSGSVSILFLYDVSEEIALDQLRNLLKATALEHGMKHAAAEQIYFQRPPVIEPFEPLTLENGELVNVQIKYYDYGVVSAVFEFPFAGEWQELIQLASHWMSGTEFEQHASRIAHQRVERARAAFIKPYPEWLAEDYFVFKLRDIAGSPSANELVASHGEEIAQIVRGETGRLSRNEYSEVLQSALSYYPNDLAVIGWNAAFIYDSVAEAESSMRLLEYANSQLLEFRRYDELLTGELAQHYRTLGRGNRLSLIDRWRASREASRLLAVLLEVTELTERVDNAIKFLSDMFSARFYRLAASKIGVPDYRNLVVQKLDTAEDLHRFLIDQFHQGRAFVLELMVVIILIIELVYAFRGKG